MVGETEELGSGAGVEISGVGVGVVLEDGIGVGVDAVVELDAALDVGAMEGSVP